MAPRTPYADIRRKLVLGIDLGTTYSGISYCLLEPGKIPKIIPVTRYPPQLAAGGDSKVPSVIFYDSSGRARAIGAETMDENVRQMAEEECWEKAMWFKLYMRPDSITGPRTGVDLPPLPTDKTPVDLFADFLRYLLKCARTFIAETYPSGDALWITLFDSIEFVLSHPNAWGGVQQSRMRRAAVRGGLVVNDAAAERRIHFVTEGEASLNFCILNGLSTDPLNNGRGVIIVDAGGGTVDISAYRNVSSGRGDSFEEIAPIECLMDGSVFVTREAERYFHAALKNSKFAEEVPVITEQFDETTKLTFRNATDFSYIKFGGRGDNDPAVNISLGKMKLSGEVMASFFASSLNSIVAAVKRQKSSSKTPISSVFLVGGYSASEWLYAELKRRLHPFGLEVSRPDSHVNKAVSDGSVSFYIDHFVSARVSKDAYGSPCEAPFRADDPEHVSRISRVYTALDGVRRVPDSFSVILKKNVRVEENTEFRETFVELARSKEEMGMTSMPIWRYTGKMGNPRWTDVAPDQYSSLCIVTADTSALVRTLQPQRSSQGLYYCLSYEIVLSFGMTELKAQIAWMEDGIERRGPARVLYESVGGS